VKKIVPPGWESSQIVHRIDGYIVDPENPGHVPSRVAALIRAARTGGDSISDVRERMIARQHALERTLKRRRAIEARMLRVRHDDA
jgi:hypothetical protein